MATDRTIISGMRELAKFTGYARTYVYDLLDRDKLPKPFDHSSDGKPLWYADEIEKWLSQRGRRKS